MVCFGMSAGSLFADDWVCIFALLVIWVRCPALDTTDSCVRAGLVYRWRPLWEFSLINTPWGH